MIMYTYHSNTLKLCFFDNNLNLVILHFNLLCHHSCTSVDAPEPIIREANTSTDKWTKKFAIQMTHLQIVKVNLFDSNMCDILIKTFYLVLCLEFCFI